MTDAGNPATTPPTAPRRNRRNDLLAAFRDLVLEQGERVATLDAVAAAADVSKGGLLYHFGSRDALVTGLSDRFTELVERDIAEAEASGADLVEWYLRTSTAVDSELETTMAALMRLAQHHEPIIRPALIRARDRWAELLVGELGDAQLATLVQLLGDGIAYNAELEGPAAAVSRFGSTTTAAELAGLVRALVLLRRSLGGAADAR